MDGNPVSTVQVYVFGICLWKNYRENILNKNKGRLRQIILTRKSVMFFKRKQKLCFYPEFLCVSACINFKYNEKEIMQELQRRMGLLGSCHVQDDGSDRLCMFGSVFSNKANKLSWF